MVNGGSEREGVTYSSNCTQTCHACSDDEHLAGRNLACVGGEPMQYSVSRTYLAESRVSGMQFTERSRTSPSSRNLTSQEPAKVIGSF